MMETVVMTGEQKRHLHEVADTWQAYGPILQSKRQLVGGLQWKTVAGNEYLYRYQPDPITKQKRSTSVGRRSPETEALYDAFVTARDQLTARSAEIEPILETQARVSKALRLNRYSEDDTRVVTALWEDGLLEHVLAMGDNAVAAYEVEYGRLIRATVRTRMPRHADDLPRDSLVYLVPDDEDFVETMLATLRRLDRSYEVVGNKIQGDRSPNVWIFSRDQIFVHLHERGISEDIETVELLLDLPIVARVAISHSGYPVPVNAVHPVALATFELIRGQDADLATTITSLALNRDTEGYDIQDYFDAAHEEEPDDASPPRMRP